MNLLSKLMAMVPNGIVKLLLVVAIVFGSHAGLDYLVALGGDSCVPLDTSTSVCLVPKPMATGE